MNEAGAGSQQRLATILFADVSGFTAMSRRLDPEDVTDIMNRCFRMLEAIVTRHGGTVEQYIGDCILAAFGVADAAPDAPAHAIHAALEIRDRLAAFNDERELPARLEIHAGIETGAVNVSPGGAGKRSTLTGPVVQLADWLKDAAPLRAVWVGPGTRAAAGDAFAFVDREPTEAKGGARLAVVHEVASETVAGATAGAHVDEGPAGDGNRRQTTVIFAELGGLTAAETVALMPGRRAAVDAVVARYGGHVDKYVGDCVMALFGAPLAIEDAPRQAVNAAIEIRNLVARLNGETPATPLHFRAGINSGLVLAGEVGGAVTRDFTVMGDTVNVASRLKDAAGTDAILVGPDTHAGTRGDFRYGEPVAMRFKGIERALATATVESRRPQTHGGRAGHEQRTLLSRMVGRDRELGAIREALARLAGGTGTMVTILAEAGLGKSRLLAEMVRLDEAEGATVLQGRCLSIGGSLSFHPFIDLLREWIGADPEATDAETRPVLAAALGELLGAEAADVLPFVATLMAVTDPADVERVAGIEGEALEKLLAWSVRRVVEALAARRPLLLLLEDLHWADLSSIRLLEALLPIVHDHPVLFVLAFRPHYTDTSDQVLKAARAHFRTRHVELPLGPLNDKECAALLRHLIRFDDRPHTTRRVILSRAQGNPFYVEEVIRSLLDVGAIEETPGGLRVTEKIESATVPSTIQGVVMARIDRLPEPVRQVVQEAAVIGRTFPLRLLASVTRDPAELAGGIAELHRHHLLEDAHRGAEEGYAFTHALAQETVYESILKKTRRELHARVARAIETLFGDRLHDFYGMLAYHYGQAQQLEKAGEYLLKAGDEAARSAASNEALHYFQEAARTFVALHGADADPAMCALLDKKIGIACLSKGDLPKALDHFDQALGHLGEDAPRTQLQTLGRLAGDLGAILYHVYLRRGRPRRRPPPPRPPRRPPTPRTLETIDVNFHKGKAQSTSAPQGYFISMLRGIRTINGVDPTAVQQACGIYAASAALFSFSGISFDVGRRFLRMSRRLITTVHDEIGFRSMAFLHHYVAGDWSDEYAISDELIDAGLLHGAFWEANTYLGLMCEKEIYQGRWESARRHIARIARIGDEYGYDFVRTNEYFMSALLLQQQDRAAEARTALDRYEAICTEEALTLLALGTRARIELACGDERAAERASHEAADIAARLHGQVAPYHLSPHLVARFQLDLLALEDAVATGHRGRVRARARTAARSGRAARGIAGKIARERPEVYKLLGRLAWLRGRPRHAERWWRRAMTEAERLGAVPEQVRILHEASMRLRTPAHGAFAGTAADELAARADALARTLADA